jgi:hypothetical protein
MSWMAQIAHEIVSTNLQLQQFLFQDGEGKNQ